MTQEVAKTWTGFKPDSTLLSISWDYLRQEVTETWLSNEPGTDMDTPGAMWNKRWEASFHCNGRQWTLSSLSLDHLKQVTEKWHIRMAPPIASFGGDSADNAGSPAAAPPQRATAIPRAKAGAWPQIRTFRPSSPQTSTSPSTTTPKKKPTKLALKQPPASCDRRRLPP